MSKERTLAAILEIGVVPIVRCDSAAQAIEAARAIYRSGIRALEVTMTVPGAIWVLEKVVDEFGDKIVLGAGTVLDPETARACMLGRPFTTRMRRRPSRTAAQGSGATTALGGRLRA